VPSRSAVRGAGSITAFLQVYLEQIALLGYHDSPLEQDARSNEFDAG
jgi:hypothetical protein